MKKAVLNLILILMMAAAWTAAGADVSAAHEGAAKQADNAALYSGYIQQALDAAVEEKSDPQADGLKSAAPKIKPLSGVNQVMYDLLKGQIAEVASGVRASTVFTISLDALGLENKTWTASDLGVEALTDEDGIPVETVQALMAAIGYDLQTINLALQATMPYELYWYDKVSGVESSGFDMETGTDGDQEWITITSGMMLSFSVASGFADGSEEFTVDTSCGTRVQNAVAAAEAIVAGAGQEADVQKLVDYREEICKRTSYNYMAVGDTEMAYGDPWQIISVFDGDPETNVVCEGYAKAFQFLCDLTEFNSDTINCRTVTGYMYGGTGSGDHMWNIVTMEDGNNYLADVTNCDEDCVGEPGLLFLAGTTEGNPQEGYTFDCNYEYVTYYYDDSSFELYEESDLTIASEKYAVDESGEEYEEGGLIYSVTPRSATVMGFTGQPVDLVIPEEVKGVPVKDIDEKAFRYCSTLRSVTFPSNIRRIGSKVSVDGGESGFDGSFTGCNNLTTVSFVEPSSLQMIGFGAFMDCSSLTSITIPDGTKTIAQNALSGTAIRSLELPASIEDYSSVNYLGQLEEINMKQNTDDLRSEDGILYWFNPFYGYVMICYPAKKNLEQYTVPSWVDYLPGDTFFGKAGTVVIGGKTQIEAGGDICCDSFAVSADSEYYAAEDGILYNKEMDDLIAIPQTRTGTVVIKDSVRKMEQCAGYGGQFTSVVIPEGVTEIPSSCFAESKLTTVEMPDSVEVIAPFAFHGCEDLKITSYPKNLKKIVENAFANVDVTQAVLPEGFEELGYQAFAFSKGAGELFLPSTVKTLGLMCLCESSAVVFTGDMPQMDDVLTWWHIRLYYPADNPTWDPEALKERAKTPDIDEEWIPYTGDPADIQDLHNWDVPEYTWSEDYSEVTAVCVCLENPNHKITETVKTTSEVTCPATQTTKGETTYTAVFSNPVFETVEKVVDNIDMLPGDDPPGDDPPGDDPPGDDPPGDDPSGDDPSGEDPSGDDPSGDDPSGDDPSGDDPPGDDPSGDDPSGDDPSGDDPSGGEPQKEANPLKVKATVKYVKARVLKRKAVTVSPLKILEHEGKLSFRKVSGKKKFRVTSSGKVKVLKGTKKGKYIVRIEVTANGTDAFEPKTIIKKVTIRVR